MPDYPNPDFQRTPADKESNQDLPNNKKLTNKNDGKNQVKDESRDIVVKTSVKTDSSSKKKPDHEPSADELSETIRKERPAKRNITAFAAKPRNAFFDAQLREEEIALLLRRHPITQLSKIFLMVGAFFFPIVMFSSPFLQFMTPNYKAATVVAWYLILFGFSLELFLTWFFNVFIVTNRRVIDVDFYSMIHKDISSAKLENIQDMSVVTHGVFASIIDFGTLYIQTAGQKPRIEFEDIPHPSKVAKVLNELISKKKRMLSRVRSGL